MEKDPKLYFPSGQKRKPHLKRDRTKEVDKAKRASNFSLLNNTPLLQQAALIKERYQKHHIDGKGKTRRKSLCKADKKFRENVSLDLRVHGYSYPMIGELLGVTDTTAYNDVTAALERSSETKAANRDRIREVEVDRIDTLINALYRNAKYGALVIDDKGHPVPDPEGGFLRIPDQKAIAQIMRLQERKAKFLGLDAPVRTQIGGDPDSPPIGVGLSAEAKTLGLLERFLLEGE